MIANIMTISRLPLAGAFAVATALLAGDGTVSPWGAAVLAGLAAAEELTDAFDGYIARRLGCSSVLGGILDPLADSLGRLTIYFALAMTGLVSIVVPLVMVGRDIVAAYTRIAAAITHRPTAARISGKVKAIIQACGIFAILAIAAGAGYLSPATVSMHRHIVAGLIVAGTAWSLIDYLWASAPAIKEMLAKGRS